MSVDTGKKVLLAAPRGYCAGVDRAVVAVEKALDLYGAPVYVRKQIVHNKHVVATLEKRGAIFVDETDEVPEGKTVVFSAHGVSPEVHRVAAQRSLKTIDATCPLVTKVHNEVKRFAQDDLDILLIGHEGHEEVEGTAGEAPDHVILVDGIDSIANIKVRDENKVAWLSQTTLSVDETDEVPVGKTVVFSAHGVSPEVHRVAAERSLKTIDATCPLVTKVHNEVKRFAQDDLDILLIGHEGHEEVEGTAGEAPDHVILVDGIDSIANIKVRDENKVAWLSQTTLSVDETLQTVAALRKRFPNLMDPPSDDICYATQNRQVAIKQIAPKADLVLIVGSTNSSNSVRLVEVSLEYGAKAAYLVDFADEVDEKWLEGVKTIGVSSGASVPEILVDDLLKWLAARGFGDVQVITAMEEHLLFAMPPELRKDLKAAGK